MLPERSLTLESVPTHEESVFQWDWPDPGRAVALNDYADGHNFLPDNHAGSHKHSEHHKCTRWQANGPAICGGP